MMFVLTYVSLFLFAVTLESIGEDTTMTRKDLVAHVVGLLALGVIATICFMSFAHAGVCT
jgi:hypothetical protein